MYGECQNAKSKSHTKKSFGHIFITLNKDKVKLKQHKAPRNTGFSLCKKLKKLLTKQFLRITLVRMNGEKYK